MAHPLTDFVKNLLTEARTTIDQFDVAIALGAPNDPEIWDAYLKTAADILVTMTNEGNLSAVRVQPGMMMFSRAAKPRGYAVGRPANG